MTRHGICTRRVSPHTARGPSRRRLQQATLPYLVRLNLFALGFQYIPITGKAAPRKEAPIVVCNHQARAVAEVRRAPSLKRALLARSQGFPDIWLFLWRCLPVGVSAAENMRFPVMGDVRFPLAPVLRIDAARTA